MTSCDVMAAKFHWSVLLPDTIPVAIRTQRHNNLVLAANLELDISQQIAIGSEMIMRRYVAD